MVGSQNFSFYGIVFLCLVSLAVAAALDRKDTLSVAAHNLFEENEKELSSSLTAFAQEEKKTSYQNYRFYNPRNSDRCKHAPQSPLQGDENLLPGSGSFSPALGEASALIDNAQQVDMVYSNLKAEGQVIAMWTEAKSYFGEFNTGISKSALTLEFAKDLSRNVAEHVSKFIGGSVRVVGDLSTSGGVTQTCLKRPSLTIPQVQKLASDSFGIPNFVALPPSCGNGGRQVSCRYDGGICCMRPQVEFIGRYYDAAVAAMALGATRDEAFAPVAHARALAYVLEACDPDISHRGNASLNSFWYNVRGKSGAQKEYWSGVNSSLISLPLAYEILYELFNAMLIKRMRTRHRVSLPTGTQMKALNDAVYYKKIMSLVVPFDLELDPDAAFPNPGDFSSAGLVQATSLSILYGSTPVQTTPSSILSESAIRLDRKMHVPEVEPTSIRSQKNSVSVYEHRTKTWEHVSHQLCNANAQDQEYFPWRFHTHVWDKFEACCADECNFFATFRNSGSAARSNCCAGCNRHRCKTNSFSVAEHVANISAIHAPPKRNSGAEIISVVV